MTIEKSPAKRRSSTLTRHAGARVCAWLISLLFIATCAQSFADSTNSPWLTPERIFGKDEFRSESIGAMSWLKNGSGYTVLEPSEAYKNGQDHKDAKDIVRVDAATGEKVILVSATNLFPPKAKGPINIEDYAWSDDASKVLIFTQSKRVWRRNTRGDYWVYDLKARRLMKLGGQGEPSTMMFATFSPNGEKVAYVRHNDLYVQSLRHGRITRLTTTGSSTLINGTSDWVNEEELDLRNGFRWSPDSARIAYWQFDTSGVRNYTLLNTTDQLYPQTSSYAYPKAGETNSACRVGIVRAIGGDTLWFKPQGDPRNHYIPEMEWTRDSKGVVIQRLNRLQNTNTLFFMSARTGVAKPVLTDSDPAWVEVNTSWHWVEDGKRFLWLSERDGWQRLYITKGGTNPITPLTPANRDVIGLVGVDDRNGWVYYTASPDNAAQRYLYRVNLSGEGEPVMISPKDKPGTHSYDVSKNCEFAVHTYSRFGEPSVVDVVQLPEHRSLRTLEDNAKLRTKLAELKPCSHEFFRVTLTNGVQMDGWCILPADFDPAKHYPVLFHVYGEPAGQTVLDQWGGDNFLWHWMLAQQGCVVMSVDNRGTPGPKGRDWRKSIYRQIGVIASADQAGATRQILAERPYIDPARIAIWGWSGGGAMTLNAIFRYPELYHAGMAVAFVSDERLYDTIYEERYMGLPAENKEGYKNASAITFAHQLTGKLLLVHGTGDDNCHFQNCEVLVNELVKNNKQFTMMAYPNRTHAIREGKNTKLHLFETLTRYLKENLPLQAAP